MRCASAKLCKKYGDTNKFLVALEVKLEVEQNTLEIENKQTFE